MGRRLGQHFLFDPGILDRIVEALEPDPRDRVLEIGPGKGTLTARLAPRVGSVVAIEKDEELARALESGTWRAQEADAAGEGDVMVVRADALEVDWNVLMQESSPSTLRPTPFKITGNIPYAITSPLIDKALEPPLPMLVVFLVQKEVADRLAAAPGNKTYGALTVGVQAAATVERLFAVRARAFRPPPSVDSAVVRLRPRARPLVNADETAGFRRFVTQLFSQRRKQIVRSLRSVAALEKGEAESAIAAIGARPVDRVEVLSPETLVALFREVTSLTR